MAPTHVALLRGINVGKAKRVAMADLRDLIEDLGYGDVRTLLNSGNVVFGATGAVGRTAALRIEEALVARLGIASRVIVLSAAEVVTVIDANPLATIATDPSRLIISVLAQPADRAKLLPLTRTDWAPERFAVGHRVGYVWCPNGILASRLSEAVGRVVGDAVTARNLATMMKIRLLLEPSKLRE